MGGWVWVSVYVPSGGEAVKSVTWPLHHCFWESCQSVRLSLPPAPPPPLPPDREAVDTVPSLLEAVRSIPTARIHRRITPPVGLRETLGSFDGFSHRPGGEGVTRLASSTPVVHLSTPSPGLFTPGSGAIHCQTAANGVVIVLPPGVFCADDARCYTP